MKNTHVSLFSYCFKDILNVKDCYTHLQFLYLMRITSYRNGRDRQQWILGQPIHAKYLSFYLTFCHLS